MTVARAFAQWMEDNGFGVYDQDLFIGAVPLERKLSAAWWILGAGGTPTMRPITGEKGKAYIFSVNYRNKNAKELDEKLQALEESANSKNCHSLTGYDTIELEATGFQSDDDIDAEDRAIGTVEITVTLYQSN